MSPKFKIGDKVLVFKPKCPRAEYYLGEIGIVTNIIQGEFNIFISFYSETSYYNELNFDSDEIILANKTTEILYGK